MIVVPFEPGHLARIEVQPAQRIEIETMPFAGEARGRAWSMIAGEAVICSAGLMELWPGRAYAWALLSAHAGPHMLQLTRIGRRMLDACEFRRVEMYADGAFPPARQFAEMLGFVCETPQGMRGYLPDGGKAYQYARVR